MQLCNKKKNFTQSNVCEINLKNNKKKNVFDYNILWDVCVIILIANVKYVFILWLRLRS